MTKIIGCVKQAVFWLRWLTMSDRKKYAYLWNRTRDNWEY